MFCLMLSAPLLAPLSTGAGGPLVCSWITPLEELLVSGEVTGVTMIVCPAPRPPFCPALAPCPP